MTLDEERALVLKSIEGNKASWSQLMLRYSDQLLRFFRKHAGLPDYEDLTQDVWQRVLAKSSVADVMKITTSMRAYLFGVARNTLYDFYRGRKREFDPLTSAIAVFDVTLSRVFAEKQGAKALHEALPKLPVDDRLLLEMRYFDEMSTRELADAFKVAQGTIKSRLHRARKLLDEQMQGTPS